MKTFWFVLGLLLRLSTAGAAISSLVGYLRGDLPGATFFGVQACLSAVLWLVVQVQRKLT